MLKKFRKLLLAVMLALGTSSANGTSPCMDPNGCLDEWPVFILIMLELQVEHCPPMASLNDGEKKRLIEEEFKNSGSPGYLRRLRATIHYAQRKNTIDEIMGQPEAKKDLCKEFLFTKK